MKYFLISVCFFVSSINAATIPTDQALELCRAEQNALKRLLCYDAINLATGSFTAKDTAPVTAPQTQTSVPVNSNPDDSFGLEHKQKQQDADIIFVTVKKLSYSAHDELQIEFENGQQWRQQGNDYYPIAVGERHSIKRGIFNSFTLANDKNNRSIKIRRQQ
jgi:hypothetical protein